MLNNMKKLKTDELPFLHKIYYKEIEFFKLYNLISAREMLISALNDMLEELIKED